MPTLALILLLLLATSEVYLDIPVAINVDLKATRKVFDGIGAVSGGGATSKLLFTYFPKKEQRRKILEVLFNKDNGLQMLKVEMGGDDQSTEGSESSHMSQRGSISTNNYEFQLIAEAREVNPSLPICVLPWTFPGWLGKSPYDNIAETAKYVLKWLQIAREVYNVEVYCVGVWNERDFSENYIRELRRVMNLNKFKNVKIVAGEGFRMDESYSRLLNDSFVDDYDIIGVHYPGGRIPDNVRKSGKTIWASEDFSTNNLATGEGCMARTINWNFVHGNITGMLAWHLVSAFYPQIAWYRSGLAYLDENKFETEAAFDVLRYTTGHVKPGWRIVDQESGSGYFEKGGTFVTYTNGKDFTIVFETMTYRSSLCEYSNPRRYDVERFQRIYFYFSTRLDGLNLSMNYGEPRFIKLHRQGFFAITIPQDSFGVITTLPINVPQKSIISVESLPEAYFDDFEKDYKYGEEPRFWMPQKGSWEVRNGAAVQKVVEPPISWCTENIKTPYAVMGFRGKNTALKGRVMIPEGSNATSAIVGLRTNCSGCDIEQTNCGGVFMEIDFTKDSIGLIFFKNFVQRDVIGTDYRKKIVKKFGDFYDFEIRLLPNSLTWSVNNFSNYGYPMQNPFPNNNLFLIGTGNFGESHWDDLSVY